MLTSKNDFFFSDFNIAKKVASDCKSQTVDGGDRMKVKTIAGSLYIKKKDEKNVFFN